MGKHLDLDAFGEIMDEILKKENIILAIDMPEGTIEPEITSNVRAGTLEFYILLNAMEATILKMFDEMGGVGGFDVPGFLDSILGIVKKDILNEIEKNM